jgi:hypothetical protein
MVRFNPNVRQTSKVPFMDLFPMNTKTEQFPPLLTTRNIQ